MRTRDVAKRVTKSLVALGIVGGLGFGGYKWYQAAQAEPPVKPNPNTTAFSIESAGIKSSDFETTYIGGDSQKIEQMWTTKLGHDGSGNSVPEKYRVLGVTIRNNTNKRHTYQVDPKNVFVGNDGKLVYGGNSTLESGYLIAGRKFDTQRLYSPVKIEPKKGSAYDPVTLMGMGDNHDKEYDIKKGHDYLKLNPGQSGNVYFKIDQSLLEQGYSYNALLVYDKKQKQDVKTLPVILGMSADPNNSGAKGISGTDTSGKTIRWNADQHSDFDKQSLNVDKIKLVTVDSGKPYLQVNYSNHSNVAFQAHKVISYKIERKEQGKFKQVAVINDNNLHEIPSKVKTKRIITWPEKTLRKGKYRITVQGLPGQMKRQVPKVWKKKITKEDSVQKIVRVNSAKLAWYHVTQKIYGWFD